MPSCLVCRFIIFEKIDYDYRKTYTINERDAIFYKGVTLLNSICNEIINLIIGEKPFEVKDKVVFINYIINKINKIIPKLSTFTNTQLEKKLPTIHFFIHNIPNSHVDIEKILMIYECFIRKIRKQNITVQKIKDYIFYKNHAECLTTLPPHKYVNRLFAQ